MDVPIAAQFVAAGLGLDYDALRLDQATEAWLAAGAGLRDRVAGLLADALTGNGLAIEVAVIGSSSVPGLLAKPIVDLAVGVDPVAEPAAAKPAELAAAVGSAELATAVEPVELAAARPVELAAAGPAAAVGRVADEGLAADPGSTAGAGSLPASVRAALVADDWIYRGDAGSDGGHVFVLEARPWHRVAHLHVVDRGGEQWRNYLRLRDLLRRSPEARARYQAVKLRLAGQQPIDRVAYTTGKTGVITELLARSND